MRTIALCVLLLLLIRAPPLALVYSLIAPAVTGTLDGIERVMIAHDLNVAGRLLNVQGRQLYREADDYGQWTAMQTAMLATTCHGFALISTTRCSRTTRYLPSWCWMRGTGSSMPLATRPVSPICRPPYSKPHAGR